MANTDEPHEVMPKVTLLNGEVRTLDACTTVNDIKVQACRLFPGALPPEVHVLSDGVPLEAKSPAPNHASVMFSSRDKSSKSLWEEAFAAYAESGDHTGTARCIQALTDNREPGFLNCAFFDAVAQSQKQLVCAFIAAKANVNIDYGTTLLIISAQEGDADIVAMLLEAGAAVNQTMTMKVHGVTALFPAALNGHADIVTQLLAAGALVNQMNENGCTSLLLTAQKGRADIVTLLLAAGAAVNHATKDGRTALFQAAQNGHADIVTQLLAAGALVNQMDKDGWTALLLAAKNGHADIVTRLLAAGALVNQMNKDGCTALSLAAKNGHADIVTRLLAAGALVNQMNKDGRSNHHRCAPRRKVSASRSKTDSLDSKKQKKNGHAALLQAAQNGHADIVTQLLAAGALVNQMDKDGRTALLLAAQEGHADIVTQLLAAGAAANHATNDGLTALLFAAQIGHADIVTQLLAAGAAVNHADSHQSTALATAAESRHTEVVTLLVQAGAALDSVDDDGDTVVACAAIGGAKNEDMIAYLLSLGAPIGETALVHAVKSGAVDVVKLLLLRDASLVCARVEGKNALEWALDLLAENDENKDGDEDMDADEGEHESDGADESDDEDEDQDEDVKDIVRQEIVDVLKEAACKDER